MEKIEIYDGNDFNKIYEALSKLKSKKLKINIILKEKHKSMKDYPNFEQNYNSKTAKGI